ncbi:MAG: pseudaminic acid synthase, partial [Bacteroidota bacterium]
MNKKHCYIIAELSANHGNRLEIALDSVRAIKATGADAVKLQTFRPESMTLDSDKELFMANPKGAWAGRRLFDLYSETMLPWEWHQPIFELAAKLELDCFSSPFDQEAVDFLEQFNPPAYKIASFEITDVPLIEYAAAKGKPMIISTGVARLSDIENAITACKKVGNEDITILKCTSAYPTPPEDMNLRMMQDIAERFSVKVGLSDHSLGTAAPMLAVALGASVIEKHFILDRSIISADAAFSLDPTEFKQLVDQVRLTETLLGEKNYTFDAKMQQRSHASRSIFIIKDVKKGEVLNLDNIKSIRPRYGLAPKLLPEVLGKRFVDDFERGTPLR